MSRPVVVQLMGPDEVDRLKCRGRSISDCNSCWIVKIAATR